jgi:hypothetical protein
VSTADITRSLIVGGLVWYGIFWWWPESARLFGQTGVWRSAPSVLARAIRRRGNELYLFGLLSQAWALVLILRRRRR